MDPATSADPFRVLGVTREAGESEIRARYLELVKMFPPERDPAKFREIREAYEAAKDPLLIAKRLLQRPDDEAPEWREAIESQAHNPPRLTPELLLSLGNRAADYAAPSADSSPGSPVGDVSVQ